MALGKRKSTLASMGVLHVTPVWRGLRVLTGKALSRSDGAGGKDVAVRSARF